MFICLVEGGSVHLLDGWLRGGMFIKVSGKELLAFMIPIKNVLPIFSFFLPPEIELPP